MAGHKVVVAPSALEAALAITDRAEARRVRSRLVALETLPLLGEVYDPVYETSRPPFEVLVTFTKYHGIYYTYDEASGVVSVEYIEDCRRDPMMKFK